MRSFFTFAIFACAISCGFSVLAANEKSAPAESPFNEPSSAADNAEEKPEIVCTSPKGTFRIETVFPQANDLERQYVVSTADPKVREPLGEERDAQPAQYFISPDERWIFATYHLHSHAESGKLFKRGEGLKFQEIAAADSDEAWKFFAKKEGELDEQDFEIIDFVAWSPDSNRLLVDLRGGSRETSGIYLWYAYFNTKTGKFELTDYLQKLNKGARDRWKNFQPERTFASFPEAASAEPLTELPSEAELKKSYEESDRRLNKTYQQIFSEIDKEERESLRQDERDWLKTRERGAKFYAESGSKSTARRRYWQHMLDSTQGQLRHLETYWKPKLEND